MNKEALVAVFSALFSDIKDAKTLALRAVTMFIAMLSYFIIMNQGDILEFAKNFSRRTVIEQVQSEQVADYPKVAKERASMLYTQSGADGVFIAGYKPKFINNYQDVVAWEGGITVNPGDMLNIVIDKSSNVYQQHVLGHNVSYAFSSEGNWKDSGFITSGKEYTKVGVNYLYTCPIFDMANSYSGYVGIGYTSFPYVSPEEKEMLEDYLERICNPHARALGRKK